MITKNELVESYLITMFYNKQEYERCVQEIGLKYHEMGGLKSPNLTDIHYAPEDRQHKYIRIGEEIKELEQMKDQADVKFKDTYNKLHLFELSENDYSLIEKLYYKRMTCEEVAYDSGYFDKRYVSKKRIKIVERLTKYL